MKGEARGCCMGTSLYTGSFKNTHRLMQGTPWGDILSHQLQLWSSAVQPEGLLETLLAHTCRSPPMSRRGCGV